MKIIYKENPLASHLILDDHDKEILKLKIKLDEMESIICIGEYYLEKEEADKAQKELNTEYVCDGGLDNYVNQIHEILLQDATGEHVGDCTCVACSCSKCRLESLLEVDTIPKMSKYMGSVISGVFTKVSTCAEAITLLEERYQTNEHPHVKHALDWLKWYRDELLHLHITGEQAKKYPTSGPGDHV